MKHIRVMAVMALMAAVCCTAIRAEAEEGEETWIGDEVYGYCEKYGEEYGICAELIAAIIERESSGCANAVNGDCKGLMQISMSYHKDRMERLGVTDIWDAESNIRIGADYLAELFGEYEEASLVLDIYSGRGQKAFDNYDSGTMSGYAGGILERSAELERVHNK
ncbi:MAG: lytic transglycosylase domain-containing protein [Lachnospiraceae bacterium]|nr:lytic transglycosylase domain-containing protein [Lachnospiraceae bacterium]